MTRSIEEVLKVFNPSEWAVEASENFPNDKLTLDQALKEIEAIIQQEIAKARIDEVNAVHKQYDDKICLYYSEWSEHYNRRKNELSQTLKEHN